MLILGILIALAAPGTDLEVAEAPVGASDKDVTRAEKLYEEARYEKALKALKKGCEHAADPVRCEQITAFIQIALGSAFEARAAFDRMLLHDPNASLGPDVSPKLQGMFADAKRAMVTVKAMRLEPLVDSPAVGIPLLVEVKNPDNSMVELLTAHIESPGSDHFEAIELTLEGEVWSGSWVLTETPSGDRAKYYLTVELAGEVGVAIGDESEPFSLDLPGTETGLPGDEPLIPPPRGDEGLPGWQLGLIIGGVAVGIGAVAGIIIGVVVGGQAPAPGSVDVNIHFPEG